MNGKEEEIEYVSKWGSDSLDTLLLSSGQDWWIAVVQEVSLSPVCQIRSSVCLWHRCNIRCVILGLPYPLLNYRRTRSISCPVLSSVSQREWQEDFSKTVTSRKSQCLLRQVDRAWLDIFPQFSCEMKDELQRITCVYLVARCDGTFGSVRRKMVRKENHYQSNKRPILAMTIYSLIMLTVHPKGNYRLLIYTSKAVKKLTGHLSVHSWPVYL